MKSITVCTFFLILAGCVSSPGRLPAQNMASPSLLPVNSKVLALAMGDAHACAIIDGEVECWGSNRFHQLEVPKDLKDPLLLSAYKAYTCAL